MSADSTFRIRPYHTTDLTALYRICLQTVDHGSDGRHLFSDPDLAGHFYVGPYASLESDLCFVLLSASAPVGYICGTRDVTRFRQNCEQQWFPPLRERYARPDGKPASPDAELIAMIHAGIDLNEDVRAYPARLHIALLPKAQRRGWGRKLIDVFLNRLRELQVPAVHLEVSRQNLAAIRFYEAVGLHRIIEYPGAVEFGMQLGRPDHSKSACGRSPNCG